MKTMKEKKHELQEIVAVVNNKGGVGKTTTVQSLAAGLVRLKPSLRVLVIDLDPQCNLSSLMRLSPKDSRTIFDAMCEQSGVTVYKCYNGVYAVCGSAQMQNVEQHLPGGSSFREMKRSYYVLAKCLQDCEIYDETGDGLKSVFDDFDYVFIDCPPSLSKITYNAMLIASSVLVPLQLDSLSIRGLAAVLDVMDEITGDLHLNDDLVFAGLLPVMVKSRTKISRENQAYLDEHFKDKVLGTGVHDCIKVWEAQARNSTIFDYAPYSSAGIDYEMVVKSLYLHKK